MERLLGLPAEFRVTDKPKRENAYREHHVRAGEDGALFENDERARSLLAAVINSGNGNSNDEWRQMAPVGGDHCGLRALSSLREMTHLYTVNLGYNELGCSEDRAVTKSGEWTPEFGSTYIG